MARERGPDHLESFEFEEQVLPVKFITTEKEFPGVNCDVYEIVGDKDRDLGVIKIDPGSKTDPQLVNEGKRTVERYVSGNGRLIVKKEDGTMNLYLIDNMSKIPLSVDIEVGDTMQWIADEFSHMVIYEICYPPYAPGRYTNL